MSNEAFALAEELALARKKVREAHLVPCPVCGQGISAENCKPFLQKAEKEGAAVKGPLPPNNEHPQQ